MEVDVGSGHCNCTCVFFFFSFRAREERGRKEGRKEETKKSQFFYFARVTTCVSAGYTGFPRVWGRGLAAGIRPTREYHQMKENKRLTFSGLFCFGKWIIYSIYDTRLLF